VVSLQNIKVAYWQAFSSKNAQNAPPLLEFLFEAYIDAAHNIVNINPPLPRRREPNLVQQVPSKIGSPPSRGRGTFGFIFSILSVVSIKTTKPVCVTCGGVSHRMRCADARLSPMQRARVVEPHLRLQNHPLTKLPFDKLRGNGGLLEATYFSP
jgi:hypothetical protein